MVRQANNLLALLCRRLLLLPHDGGFADKLQIAAVVLVLCVVVKKDAPQHFRDARRSSAAAKSG
jgi:hypothetical protein